MDLNNIVNFLHPRAPKSVIRSASDWCDQNRNDGKTLQSHQLKCWYERLHAPRARHHDTAAAEPLMERDVGQYPELARVKLVHESEGTLYYLQGARILGIEGAVISYDNGLFADFTYHQGNSWLDHPAFRRRRIPKSTLLQGYYATLTYPASRHFYHWMVESLPRLHLLQPYLRMIDGFIVPKGGSFIRQSLGMLGIDSDRIVELDLGTHLEFEHLLVPKFISAMTPPPWMDGWFKKAFLADSEVTADERIYISRSDTGGRTVKNEESIVGYLKARGFRIVTMSALPFAEQAQTLHRASVVIAPHGAGLSHLVFARPGTTVLEILPPLWKPPCFFVLAQAARCNYVYTVGQDQEAGHGQLSGYSIDLDAIRYFVDEWLPARHPAGAERRQ